MKRKSKNTNFKCNNILNFKYVEKFQKIPNILVKAR